ncbi:MAG: hypothetical protein ABI333_03905 [bacterium]
MPQYAEGFDELHYVRLVDDPRDFEVLAWRDGSEDDPGAPFKKIGDDARRC